jgi:hypothetical protein
MTATFEVDKSGNISLIGTRIGHFDWPQRKKTPWQRLWSLMTKERSMRA